MSTVRNNKSKRFFAVMLALSLFCVNAATTSMFSPFSVTASAASTSELQRLQSDIQTLTNHINSKGTIYRYKSSNTRAAVSALQDALNILINANIAVDGDFGPATQQAVRNFQSKYGLSVDGQFGKGSLAKMKDVANAFINANTPKKATISFSSIGAPTTIQQGSSFVLTGTINSANQPIVSITAQIKNSKGAAVISKSVSANTYSYNLKSSAIDNAMTFGKLSAGSYTLTYTAKAKDGVTNTYSKSFTVKAKQTSGKYNFSAAYNYAKKYWNTRNYSYNYYSGNNCANFVSQCLVAAGIPTSSTWKNGSYSFINVNGLKSYFQNTYGVKYISSPKASQIAAGDVIYTSSGHVMIVMGKNSAGQVLASGNTNNRDCLVVTSFYGVLKTSALF